LTWERQRDDSSMNDQEKTKQPLSEEAAELRRSLSSLIDHLPEGFLIVDAPDVKVRMASRYGLEMIGASWEEVRGIRGEEHFRYYQMLLPDGSLPKLEQLPLARVMFAGETIRNEKWMLQTRDGRRIPIICHAGPIRESNGTITGGVLSWQEVTELRRARELLQKAHDELEDKVRDRTAELQEANERLQQSLDELRLLYDEMVDGLLVADLESKRFVRANAAMCRMLGYSKEELLSMTVENIHPPEVVPSVLEKFRTHEERQRLLTENRPILRKDGTVFFADISNTRIVFHGRPCMIGIFRDITERKQTQDALGRERQSLWRMLQASDHERQTISYEIHDGLAQYLAAAGMQFQAYDSLRESSPAEARKAYETALELVRQAHSESRRLISEVRPPVIDENGLEMAISHLVYEQRRRGGPMIECRSNVQFGRLPSIMENALYRIVQEALTNACKHSKSKKVEVTLTQDGQDVRLEVQDWGIGFNPDAIEKGQFGIEGIRQRARLLDGLLTILSSPESGTLISVIVPLLEISNAKFK
jgi:PAS domain S-box-containing protein